MLGNVPFAELITFTRASAAWRFNASGILVQEGNNVPRYDYDPVTLQSRGMLFEEARTKLLLQSNALDNATWVKNGVTVTAGAATGPDGTASLAKVVTNSGASFTGSSVSQSITKAASAILYTCSIFAKAGELPRVRLFVNGANTTTARCYCDIDLTNGSVAQVVQGTAGFADLVVSIAAIGGGIYRISATFTTDTATTLACRIYPLNTSGAGDGVSGIYAGFCEAEAGAFPTSYIPTTTSTVARASDLASIADLSKIGFNPTEGTFIVDAEGYQPGAKYAFAVTDGTTNNMIGVSRQSSGILQSRVTAGGVVASIGLSSSYSGERVKVGLTYGQGSHTACMNGGAVPSIASGVPVVNQMRVGAVTTSGQINGWLRSIRYYPRKLSNAELQALTT